MYTPKHNRQLDPEALKQLMVSRPLAALITVNTTGIAVSHIPLVLHGAEPSEWVLRGHIARANSQWCTLEKDINALAIFMGPDHYISASWYPGKAENGEEVPTWNYTTVHAKGPLTVTEDENWLLRHLEDLTDASEASFSKPWKVSDAPQEFIRNTMRGIVGLEMQVQQVEGKWKVSQNRTREDQESVVRELTQLGTSESCAMRQLILEGRAENP